MRLGNRAVDAVRCRTQQEQTGHRGRAGDPLYDIRKILLTGCERLRDNGRARLDTALRAGDPKDEILATSPPEYSLCYTTEVGPDAEWQVYIVNEVREWLGGLDDATHARVVQTIDVLAEVGPGLGRPLVDTIHGSSIANLKELRPGTVRILFAFDPWRSSILLVAGDKSGRWNAWYAEAIPLAEQRYERYLKERTAEEGEQR